MIAGATLVGTIQNLAIFIVSVFFIGAGFAVTEATMSAVLTDEFTGESVRHLNFSQVAFSVGALFGPILASALIRNGIYYQHLYILWAIIFFALAIVFIFTKHHNDCLDIQQKAITIHITGFLRNNVLLFLALAIFLYVGAENTIASFTGSYFQLTLNLPQYSAIALSLYWGAMIPSRFLAGIVKTNPRKIFLVSAIFAFIGIVIAMAATDRIVKLVMFAVCGFGCGPIWPLMMDMAAKANKGSTGAVLNIMMSFCATGGALVPVLAGAIAKESSIAATFYLCATVCVVMTIVFFLSVRLKKLSDVQY
ncbi:MAG: MFS transporter [Petrimonas sp.]|nr:MFS transporter [Petrimonas sp.]